MCSVSGNPTESGTLKTENVRCGIALGSNVGDRLGYLKTARDRLRELHAGSDEQFLVSPVYETDPVDCEPGTAAFLNAVLELRTGLAPLDLLGRTQAIERDLGRPDRRARNAPRTIDVDLLYTGNLEFSHERLELPHPRLTKRRFVLVPLGELVPAIHIEGHSHQIQNLLSQLPEDEPEPNLVQTKW